ncbi:hypothetical protein [Caproicibacterium sp. BJN0003]|uniref:hypothetical protein n=1 Tax=Caproicibacterium sp. BJN0003 TaxID=2994078 RepID=UPI002254FBD6|nr:hypothetical protein [Caproicibacterium sp. BJN0003]UZT82146.1 hypothetical protein OP489_11870 [Caproicibacterium sp. BJN0003]
MPEAKNKHIPVGSCHVYCAKFLNNTIPEDSEIETETNKLGYVEKGAEVTYKPTVKTFKDDFGMTTRTVVTAEETTTKFSLISWSKQDFAKFSPTARVDTTSKPGHNIIKIGGIGFADNSPYLFRLVHNDAEYGDLRVTIVGTNTSGFKLDFKPDSSGNMDVEVQSQSLDSEGTQILLDEELPGSAAAASGLSVSSTAGTVSGTTALTVTPSKGSGNTYRYKLGAYIPNVGDDLSAWSTWDGTSAITATTGSIITVAEVDSTNKAVKASVATVVAKV